MHDALNTPDLFSLIIVHCTPNTLLSLARTCRAFSDPCLTYLYSFKIVTLHSLVRCLIPNIEISSRKGQVYFERENLSLSGELALDSNTRRRFEYYASRTKTLELSVEAMSEQIFWGILKRSEESSSSVSHFPLLFHALKSLILCIPPLALKLRLDRNVYRSFEGNALRTLTIKSFCCDFMQQLSRKQPPLLDLCPQLDSLSIHHDCTRVHIRGNCLGVVLHSQHWRELSFYVNHLPDPTVKHIISLTKLENLDIFSRENWAAPTGILPRSLGLQSLTDLSLCCSWSMVKRLVEALNNAQLRRILFDALEISYHGYDDLLLELAKNVDLSALEEFCLRGGRATRDDIGILNMENFNHLFAFGNLQKLTISYLKLPVTDHDMLIFAKSWTNLRELSFLFTTHMDLSLRSLIHLSLHCRYLDDLTLTIDGRNIPDLEQFDVGKGNMALRRLTVYGYSPIEDQQAVKELLRRLFPMLRMVKPTNIESRDDTESRIWHHSWIGTCTYLADNLI